MEDGVLRQAVVPKRQLSIDLIYNAIKQRTNMTRVLDWLRLEFYLPEIWKLKTQKEKWSI
jgi:hypothetical protein